MKLDMSNKNKKRRGAAPKINGDQSTWATAAMIECVVGMPHDELNVSVSEYTNYQIEPCSN